LYTGFFGSPGAARNYGLDLADSKYICFWDSDDLPQPKNICTLLSKQANFDVLVGQYFTIEGLPAAKITELSQDLTILDIAIKPGMWRMIFLREFVGDHRFKFMKMGEDQLFLAELIKLNPRLVFTSEHFYDYAVGRIGQLTSNFKSKLDLIATFKALLKLRAGTSGYQFEYLSATIIRLWFSLLKMLKFRIGIARLLCSLASKELILNRHPIIQLRIFFVVTSKLFRQKQL
jgi:glycosyltransferase involved in cell wall biosynthesis